MKLLFFSPMEMPFTAEARYTGLERLVADYAFEIAKNHPEIDLTVLAHKDTLLPDGVKLLPCEGYVNNDRSIHAEVKAYQQYQWALRQFDAIWDIGHLHLIARFNPNMPMANVFNHAPQHAHYPKAPYNLVSWSKWGVMAIQQYYKQQSRYQETIAIDPDVYKPFGQRGERFLTLGRMSPEKGNLNAVMLAKQMGLQLDVCGGRGSETTYADVPLTNYELAVKDLCDGKQIRFLGEVTDEDKIKLMQTCKALLYITDHAEITSHKVQEAMFCGAPVIIPALGGLPEIITQGVDGYYCISQSEYITAIKNLDKLDPAKTHAAVTNKYCRRTVVDGYLKLFEEVANGARWAWI